MSDTNGFVVAAYIVMWVGLIAYGCDSIGFSARLRRRLDDASREGRKA